MKCETVEEEQPINLLLIIVIISLIVYYGDSIENTKVILKHFFFEALKLLWNALFIAATVDKVRFLSKKNRQKREIEVPTVVEVTL